MLKTIKKIALFLFGIALVVFGNKAAINTIFGGEPKTPPPPPASNDSVPKTPAITEEAEATQAPEETVPAPVEKKAEKQVRPSAGKEPEKAAVKKTENKAAVQQQAVKEKQIEEVNKKQETTIEPEKSETASGTE
jgi:DNA polymerase III gamma/tau subunit